MGIKTKVILLLLSILAIAVLINMDILLPNNKQNNQKNYLIESFPEVSECRFVCAASHDPMLKSFGTFYLTFRPYDLEYVTQENIMIEFYWPDNQRIKLFCRKDILEIPNHNSYSGYEVTGEGRGYQFLDISDVEKIVSGYSEIKLKWYVNHEPVLEQFIPFDVYAYNT